MEIDSGSNPETEVNMKIWYLMCGLTQEYAVVFARSKEDSFERLKSQREVETTDIDYWEIEELTEDSYNGVLYFY